MLLIAKEAGLSRGPLHYHFSDKNELMAAVAERLPIRATDFARQRLAGETTAEARLAAILEIGVREHLGVHHFVAMELLLAARNDPGLAAAISPHMQASEHAIDEWWTDYLAALRWPKEKLLAFRHLTVAALRGLALDRAMHADAEVHARALDMFQEVFLTFARSKGSSEA
jgi:AcrR family transcriptional regulator